MKKRRASQDRISARKKKKSAKRRATLSMSPNARLRKKLRKGRVLWHSVTKSRRWFAGGTNKVKFPEEVDIFSNTDKFCRIFSKLAFSSYQDVIIQLEDVKFIYPEAVVYLASIVDHMLARSNVVIREQAPLDTTVREYLKVSGLHKFFYVKTNDDDMHVDPKFFGDCIPISRDAQEKVSMGQKITELLNQKLNLDPEGKQLLSESIGEIMGNAIEHGEVQNWYRIAQVHRERKRITLAIADNGVGVCHTLKSGFQGEKYNKIKDSHILKKSFESHVTRHQPRNGEAHGYGLTRIFDLVRQTQSKMAILSGAGVYAVDYTSGHMVETFFDFKNTLPGTLIVMRLSFEDSENVKI